MSDKLQINKFFLVILFLSFFFSNGYTYQELISDTIDGKYVQVLKIIPDKQHEIVLSAVNNGSKAKSLTELTNSVGGISSMNGGFFCPDEKAYSWCTPNSTDMVRISNSVLMSKRGWDIGSNKGFFGFNKEGVAKFVDDTTRYREGDQRQNSELTTITNGMSMPSLLKNGENIAQYNKAMNSDGKQSKVANKSFICSTKDNIVYMGYVDGQTFTSIADFIKKNFGCYNAILLDNGGSKAMIYNNQSLIAGRNIMEAFVIVQKSDYITNRKTQLKDILTRLKSKAITSYGEYDSFNAEGFLSREQASKFFVNYAINVYNKSGMYASGANCNFTDIENADPTLKPYIKQACKMGIFKGSEGKFYPFNKLTVAQAVTLLIRITDGKMDETPTPWYSNYISKATEKGLFSGNEISKYPNNNVNRGDVGIMMYMIKQ